MEVSTSKEVRNYSCIAVSPDDTTLYIGTTTGDVMVISAEKQTLITQGPPKGASLGCGVQALVCNASATELLNAATTQLRDKQVECVNVKAALAAAKAEKLRTLEARAAEAEAEAAVLRQELGQ